MEKIGLAIKQESEKALKNKLKSVDTILLVKYSGLSASDLNVLRNSLSSVHSSFMVAKNSVSKRVFKTYQDFHALIEGPCGIIFVGKDLISTTRVIKNFTKEKPVLEVKIGILNDSILTQEQISEISQIQSLSALQTKLVIAMKSPITRLVFSFKNILNKLVCALGQIKDRKEKQGGG